MTKKNGNIEKLLRAGQKRGISDKATRSAIQMKAPDQVVRNLRGLRYTFAEIATYDGRSPQWMSHLARGGEPASPMVKHKIADPETIIRQILTEACNDLAWWSPDRGRMRQDKVIERFRRSGYTWKEARKHDLHTRCDKLSVILMVTFGVGPSKKYRKDWVVWQLKTLTKQELSACLESGVVFFDMRPTQVHIKEWFRVQLETLTKSQVFNLINQGQTLKVSERAYVRAWNRLGLHVKIRQPRTKA